MDTTPGFTPVNDPKAVEFCMNLQLPTQLDIQLGNPEQFDATSDVHAAIVTLRGKAKESAELLARITKDETVTSPVRHENAQKVATRLIAATEATQRLLDTRAKEYLAASDEVMQTRFTVNPERHYHYDRIAEWIGREAKNGEGNGYRNIREAITDDPDFAIVMYNMSHRLLGLPADHAFNFKEKLVEHWAPEAMQYIEGSHRLSKVTARYPDFIAKVHASFYSTLELRKLATRVEV